MNYDLVRATDWLKAMAEVLKRQMSREAWLETARCMANWWDRQATEAAGGDDGRR